MLPCSSSSVPSQAGLHVLRRMFEFLLKALEFILNDSSTQALPVQACQ